MQREGNKDEAGRANGLALDLWLDFLLREGEQDGPEFENLCDRHPELAAQFREWREKGKNPGPREGVDSSLGRHLDERLRAISQPVLRGERYRKEDLIAQGGMGMIYRIRDMELERWLALKELRLLAGSEESLSVARFLEEAQITAQLDHPGIVPVHELGVDAAGKPFFAMKLVRGEDLRKVLEHLRLAQQGWTLTRILGVLLKVCEAMAYAHAKGVIHRDLKPANIMIGHFGEVFVMDWGLARASGRKEIRDLRLRDGAETASIKTARRAEREESDDSPLVTMDGAVVGTPAYMSPEQAEGEVEKLSPRSDVYALGAILYHALTGQMPYKTPHARASNRTVLAMLLLGPPEPVLKINPKAQPELIAICEKAMAREPARRYADMGELARDLAAYLEGRVVRAYRSGPWAEAKQWILRNKSLAGALATVAVLSLAFLRAMEVGRVEAKGREKEEAQRKIADARAAEAARNSELAEQNAERANTARLEVQALLGEKSTSEKSARLIAAAHSVIYDNPALALNLAFEAHCGQPSLEAETLMLDALCAQREIFHISLGAARAVKMATVSDSVGVSGSDGTLRVVDLSEGQELLLDLGRDLVDWLWNGPKEILVLRERALERKRLLPNGGVDSQLLLEAPKASQWTCLNLLEESGLVAAGLSTGQIAALPLSQSEARWGQVHAGSVREIALLANAGGIVSIGDDGRLVISAEADVSELLVLQTPAGPPPTRLCLNSEQGWLAATARRDANDHFVVWHLSQSDGFKDLDTSLQSFDETALARPQGDGMLVWSPRPDGIVFASPLASTRDRLPTSQRVTSACFSRAGHWVALGQMNGDIDLIDWETRSSLIQFHDPNGVVRAVAPCANDQVVCSMTDSGVSCFSLERREPLLAMRDRERVAATDLSWSMDERSLAICDRAYPGRGESQLLVLQVEDKSILRVPLGMCDPVKVAFVNEDQTIAVGMQDGGLMLIDVASGELVGQARTQLGPVNLIAYDSVRRRILTGSYGRLAINSVGAMKFAPEDATAHLWSFPDLAPVAALGGHLAGFSFAEFSPEAEQIFLASYDGVISLWDAAELGLIARLPHGGSVSFAAFAAAGGELASFSWDGSARVFSTASATLLAEESAKKVAISDGAVSSDGKILLLAYADGSAAIWNRRSVEPVREFPSFLRHGVAEWRNPAGVIAGSYMSPDGRFAFLTGQGGVAHPLCFVDLQQGKGLLTHHASPKKSIDHVIKPSPSWRTFAIACSHGIFLRPSLPSQVAGGFVLRELSQFEKNRYGADGLARPSAQAVGSDWLRWPLRESVRTAPALRSMDARSVPMDGAPEGGWKTSLGILRTHYEGAAFRGLLFWEDSATGVFEHRVLVGEQAAQRTSFRWHGPGSSGQGYFQVEDNQFTGKFEEFDGASVNWSGKQE